MTKLSNDDEELDIMLQITHPESGRSQRLKNTIARVSEEIEEKENELASSDLGIELQNMEDDLVAKKEEIRNTELWGEIVRLNHKQELMMEQLAKLSRSYKRAVRQKAISRATSS